MANVEDETVDSKPLFEEHEQLPYEPVTHLTSLNELQEKEMKVCDFAIFAARRVIARTVSPSIVLKALATVDKYMEKRRKLLLLPYGSSVSDEDSFNPPLGAYEDDDRKYEI